MGWMDPLFDGTAVAGKLLCPNGRCKAKIGNYSWSGQRCGCGAWITPGFCLARGKVDGRSFRLLLECWQKADTQSRTVLLRHRVLRRSNLGKHQPVAQKRPAPFLPVATAVRRH